MFLRLLPHGMWMWDRAFVKNHSKTNTSPIHTMLFFLFFSILPSLVLFKTLQILFTTTTDFSLLWLLFCFDHPTLDSIIRVRGERTTVRWGLYLSVLLSERLRNLWSILLIVPARQCSKKGMCLPVCEWMLKCLQSNTAAAGLCSYSVLSEAVYFCLYLCALAVNAACLEQHKKQVLLLGHIWRPPSSSGVQLHAHPHFIVSGSCVFLCVCLTFR